MCLETLWAFINCWILSNFRLPYRRPWYVKQFFVNNVMTFCLIFLRSPKMALLYFIVQTFLTFCVKTLKVNQSLLILLSTWQSKFYGLIGTMICLLSNIKLKITRCFNARLLTLKRLSILLSIYCPLQWIMNLLIWIIKTFIDLFLERSMLSIFAIKFQWAKTVEPSCFSQVTDRHQNMSQSKVSIWNLIKYSLHQTWNSID